MSIFGRFLMKTLNLEIDACTELSWDSHEILMRLKFSHEILMRVQWSHELLTSFSWDSHEILVRLSRDSYEIVTRFRYTGITNTNPIHHFFSSTFFFVRLATFVKWPWLQKKSTTSSASISIKTSWSQTATVSFKHFHCLYSQHFFGKTQVASFASDS